MKPIQATNVLKVLNGLNIFLCLVFVVVYIRLVLATGIYSDSLSAPGLPELETGILFFSLLALTFSFDSSTSHSSTQRVVARVLAVIVCTPVLAYILIELFILH